MKKITLLLMSFALFGISNAQDNLNGTSNNPASKSGTISFTTEPLATTGWNRAVVDMNGDFLDDVVSIENTNVNIFYQLEAGGFEEVNITTTPANYMPSWSLAAGDYDKNGYTDLMYGSGSGVTFMRANNTGTGFTEISGPESIFSQRSNFVDINNDGHMDAFMCHDIAPNVYYINDGTGNLVYQQGGLGDYPTGGNYGSVWIDYNNDRNIDLFIAKCGGEPARRTNQMHTNNGDGTYTENAEEIGLADDMQTWSSAWGDYDNDGDMDVFVGASTDTHKLMRNNGNSTFTDVTAASGVLLVTQTGIENAAHDFNNDGFIDIVSNGNILLGNGDLTFTDIAFNALPGDNGGLGDLNNDGFIDSFLNETIFWNTPNANNWLTINTVGVQSNINGIGARIELTSALGTQIRDVRSGEGFRFMSTLNSHFGLGADTEIQTITIYWPSGIIDVLQNQNTNQVLNIVEGQTLGLEDTLTNSLILYPNPATDVLNLNTTQGLENAIYTIFSIDGKLIQNNRVASNTIDVSALSSGNYILRIVNNGDIKTQKFIKK